jgi:hypothetical protein
MKASVRRFHSPDVDLPEYVPVDPTNVGVLVQALVGPDGGPGEETFDIMVCTPAWLAERLNGGRTLVGRHHFFVDRFDTQRVLDGLTQVIEAESAETWDELAGRLARIGKWEFEDYQD